MQQITSTTSVTDKGYILLPVKIREALRLKPRQSVQISVTGTTAHITPHLSLEDVFNFIKPTKRPFTQKELKVEEQKATQTIAENATSEGI